MSAPIRGPAHEYIRLLRSYLSEHQKAFVRDQIEARCLRGRNVSDLQYADICQSFLNADQRREVVSFLRALYERRGWLPSSLRFARRA